MTAGKKTGLFKLETGGKKFRLIIANMLINMYSHNEMLATVWSDRSRTNVELGAALCAEKADFRTTNEN